MDLQTIERTNMTFLFLKPSNIDKRYCIQNSVISISIEISIRTSYLHNVCKYFFTLDISLCASK